MYNFGKIKENIYEIAADGIASKDNKKKSILKKYITTIKESEILRMEASIYDNIETKCDTNDYSASEYVKENISLLQRYNISDIVKENKKLEILLEGYDIVDDYNKKTLHENIHTLITTNKTAKTINQIVESSIFVKDYILKNEAKVVIKEDFIPHSMLVKYLNEKFTAKYNSLNESEVKLIKTVFNSNEVEQSQVFETEKKETLRLINESIKVNSGNLEVKGKLLDVKERLLENKFNKETFVGDIVKIMNLQKKLND